MQVQSVSVFPKCITLHLVDSAGCVFNTWSCYPVSKTVPSGNLYSSLAAPLIFVSVASLPAITSVHCSSHFIKVLNNRDQGLGSDRPLKEIYWICCGTFLWVCLTTIGIQGELRTRVSAESVWAKHLGETAVILPLRSIRLIGERKKTILMYIHIPASMHLVWMKFLLPMDVSKLNQR